MEEVRIIDGDETYDHILSNESVQFFAHSSTIIIEFLNDERDEALDSSRDVFFQTDLDVRIEHENLNIWQCDIVQRSSCRKLQAGEFNWGGNYTIFFLDNSKYYLLFYHGKLRKRKENREQQHLNLMTIIHKKR